MRAHLALFAVLGGLLLPSLARSAEESYTLPDYIRQAPTLPAELAGADPRNLLLEEAVMQSVEGNLGVRLERDRRAIRRASLISSHSAFEPRLFVSYDHFDGRAPPSSSVDGAADELFMSGSDGVTIGLSQALPHTATQFGVSFSSRRTSSSLGTAVEPLVIRDALTLTLRQPLLKGFGFDVRVPRANVLRAKWSSEASTQELRVRLAGAIQTTEDRYWDLVLALKGHEVQSGSLLLAEQQLELTRRQIESGVLPPSDLIQAESTLAQRELSIVRATASINAARDQLWRVLGAASDEAGRAVLPLDAPTFDERPVDFDAALALAQERRPELLRMETELRQATLGVAVATNELLPELSVDLGLGVVGQDSTNAEAARKLGTFEARTFSAGVEFSWAPAMRGGVGGIQQARASRRIANTSMEQARVDVELEVRAAHRELITASRQVHAAARFRDAAERSLAIEERRFMDGISSNFLIGQRQSELAQSQLAELSALIAHRKARTAWEVATGQLLVTRGIVLD
ncbi:MAG: TolC family protein [Deltaproteobacteria bacterium]|nr:TolC family protein [Deltaproteobacteria bacterium]